MFLGLTKKEIQKLEYEVISNRARLKLTRLIRRTCKRDDSETEIIIQNRFINIARNIMHLPVYILEVDD